MKLKSEWAEDVKRLLRARIARRRVTYEDLSEKLATIRINNTAVNLGTRWRAANSPRFFLVQCLTAMGARALRLTEGIDGR